MNSAGVSPPVGIGSAEEAWSAADAVRVVATRQAAEALLPSMQRRSFGRIIHIVGLFELHGPISATTAMDAARTVTVHLKGLSHEVARYGVTVHAVTPGRVDSEQRRRRFPTLGAMAEFARDIPMGRRGIRATSPC